MIEKKNNELISIVLPSYNSSKYISITIDSVLNQEYSNWELIITDDCSTDNTLEILNEYAQKENRIKIYKLEINSGAAMARNNCLKYCDSKFIAFIDSDDSWHKEKLGVQVAFMQKNNFPISFTSYKLVDESGEDLNRTIPVKISVDYDSYLKNTIIGMCTSMVNTNITGPLQFKNIRTRQDTYLWITLLKKGFKAYGLDTVLASYRVRSNSISSNKFKAVKQVWKLYYEFENLGFFKASYYLVFYIFNAIKKRYL
jgi:teichuronic acid biosynthesis glycosyltransferase TuaG